MTQRCQSAHTFGISFAQNGATCVSIPMAFPMGSWKNPSPPTAASGYYSVYHVCVGHCRKSVLLYLKITRSSGLCSKASQKSCNKPASFSPTASHLIFFKVQTAIRTPPVITAAVTMSRARRGLAIISASSRCLFACMPRLEQLFVPICLIVLLDSQP